MTKDDRIKAKKKIQALKVAAQYEAWLQKNRRGSTFSTFVDEFGYDKLDAGFMFRIIEPIRAAAKEICR